MNGSLLQQLSLFDCFMSFFVLCFRILILPFNPVVRHDDRELGAEEYFYNHISFTDFFYQLVMPAMVVYSRDQLIGLNKLSMFQRERLEIRRELRKRSCGCRAGVKRQIKKRKYKPSIPAIIMGNVRSLLNKVDELEALTISQVEYRQCSIMCLTES